MKLILVLATTCLGLVTSLSIPTEGRPSCPEPSQEDCAQCDLIRNPQRYLPNPCTCGYFQCQPTDGSNKVFDIKTLRCSRCTCWNQEVRTCTHDPTANNCIAGITEIRNVTVSDTKCTDGYGTNLGVVENDVHSYYTYLWGTSIKMPCAPGTHFSLIDCTCVHGGGIIQRMPLMCMSFDGSDPFATEPYMYVDPVNVEIVNDGVIGRAAYLNGLANIEIPFFDGKESGKLSVVIWMKRELGGVDPLQAIMSNDNCREADILGPSIQIRSESPDTIGAGYQTDQNHINAFTGLAADDGEWHHVALVYDGEEITLYLDGDKHTPVSATGLIKSVHCPLRIGSMYNDHFFQGWIDEVCFFDYALDEDSIKEHYEEGMNELEGSESGSGNEDESGSGSGSGEELVSCSTSARDCQDHLDMGSTDNDVYCITLGSGDNERPVLIYCDMVNQAEAWNVILKRFDGSVSFDTNLWLGFKEGIGSVYGEYYLGNDNVHDLTVTNNILYELRVDLESESGYKGHALYRSFSIRDESEKYKLDIGVYDRSSTLSDCLSHYHNQSNFSTSDQDNDNHEKHCAQVNTGGWWYNACAYCKLMSGYGPNGNQYNRMGWNNFNNVWIKEATMKVRRVVTTGAAGAGGGESVAHA